MQTITIDQVIDISNALTVDWFEINMEIASDDNLYRVHSSLYNTNLPATFFDALRYCESLDESDRAAFLESVSRDLSVSLKDFVAKD